MKMEDIAALAGVSKSAVSLAFSGKPGIGQETRERILQVAKENGYLPKTRAAQPEAASKSLTFLVLANSGIVLEQYYQQPFFRELIHYIEVRCRAKGYSLLFTSIDVNAFSSDSHALAEDIRSDGVILLGTNLDRGQIASLAESLPAQLVVLDTCFETLPVHFITINNVMGGYQAGEHLCELGHEHIGYLASNVRISNFDDRRKGFMSALEERGLSIDENDIFSVAPTITSFQEELKNQLAAYQAAGRQLPTAFFCECDYIAISAIKTLTDLGFRVPEDTSVVGFDNISEARIVSPELTTVHVEKERMAHLAVDLAIEAIEQDHEVKTKIAVDTQFIVRHSSSAPANR